VKSELIVTTSHKPDAALRARADRFAQELECAVAGRHAEGMSVVFGRYPEAQRALIVQSDRLLLVDRAGNSVFFHPNLGAMRLRNVLRGQPDYLLEAVQLQAGDSLLDCTLGYAGEATLCAHVIGDSGEVHGIEGNPELGVVVREGLQVFKTDKAALNEAMRRVQVVHLGHHLEFLRQCPDKRYDVVYFDPFFDVAVDTEEMLVPLKIFGDHSPLTAEALTHARRVARRRVVVKTARWSEQLADFEITELVGARHGRVVYGVLPVGA
jgi:16S rRNA (guanine1516-N2)-methyltransferase